MKQINYQCKSKKHKGLLVGFVELEDGSFVRISGKPEGGERIEAKMREIEKRKKGGDPKPLTG
jgi:uncharacterized OB-fold protein